MPFAVLPGAPRTRRDERRLAAGLHRRGALTRVGADRQESLIAQRNLALPAAPLTPLPPIHSLWFGFIVLRDCHRLAHPARPSTLLKRPFLSAWLRFSLTDGSSNIVACTLSSYYREVLRARLNRLQLSDLVDWQPAPIAKDTPQVILAHPPMARVCQQSNSLNLPGARCGTCRTWPMTTAGGRIAITSKAITLAVAVAPGNGPWYPHGTTNALSKGPGNLANHPYRAQEWAEQTATLGRARTWEAAAKRLRRLFFRVVQERDDVA
ncbi:MAG: hypothetical protein ABWY06_18875 [Pseudomonas sp.]|uniref:hypothetical protein n=1 Tax=Pseudomonas sp. TaxID=306 RepID=UPI003393686B